MKTNTSKNTLVSDLALAATSILFDGLPFADIIHVHDAIEDVLRVHPEIVNHFDSFLTNLERQMPVIRRR